MKVAIVGSSPSSEHLAPFGTDYKMWVTGARYAHYKSPVDRIFEIHDFYSTESDYVNSLVSSKVDLIVSKKFPVKGKNIKIFPFDRIKEIRDRGLYLKSTCAYMIALAILEGAEEIALFGIDMSVDDNEYFKQRSNAENWLGIAEGRGIKITLPEQCPLLKSSYIYGIGEQQADSVFKSSEFDIIANQHEQQIKLLSSKITELDTLIATHSGCLQAYKKMSQVARACEGGDVIKSLNDTLMIK